jgi:hypothetical protein
MTVINFIRRPVSSGSAAFFRIIFGVLMSVSAIRFIGKGWVHDLYVKPVFFFTYYGFSWIRPLPAWAIYCAFWLMVFLGICIAAGFFYRTSMLLFFVIFTYTELIDVTNYLNHYYLISLLSFLMIFLPLNSAYALDNILSPSTKKTMVPFWVLLSLRMQVGIVYFFGGVSKIKYDWLIEAQPLRIWLPANSHLPLIGQFFDQEWVAYFFSWAAMLFDLAIPFLLTWKHSRIYALMAVIIFHFLTALLFPIGMFPWFMTIFVLVFFSPEWHDRILYKMSGFFSLKNFNMTSISSSAPVSASMKKMTEKMTLGLLSVFFIIQCVLPFRYLLFPSNVLWTEQGYRFSWNIMLMEKRSYIEFYVKNKLTGKTEIVLPMAYLTRQQQLMMSTQPDMILQFAHYIKKQYYKNNMQGIEVHAECYTTLNGKPSRLLVDPAIDLASEKDGWEDKGWILRYD